MFINNGSHGNCSLKVIMKGSVINRLIVVLIHELSPVQFLDVRPGSQTWMSDSYYLLSPSSVLVQVKFRPSIRVLPRWCSCRSCDPQSLTRCGSVCWRNRKLLEKLVKDLLKMLSVANKVLIKPSHLLLFIPHALILTALMSPTWEGGEKEEEVEEEECWSVAGLWRISGSNRQREDLLLTNVSILVLMGFPCFSHSLDLSWPAWTDGCWMVDGGWWMDETRIWLLSGSDTHLGPDQTRTVNFITEKIKERHKIWKLSRTFPGSQVFWTRSCLCVLETFVLLTHWNVSVWLISLLSLHWSVLTSE